jgi:hypothetical protein
MSDNDPAATDHRVGGPPPTPAAGSSRRAKRRQHMIVAAAAVVSIAVIGGGAIALFGGDANRSGTYVPRRGEIGEHHPPAPSLPPSPSEPRR